MHKLRPLLIALGETIAKRRLTMDWSQQKLAENAGVHRSYMSDVERGLRNITLATLENIAQALNTTAADLLVTAYAVRAQGVESETAVHST